MELFNKKIGTVFLKEDSEASQFIEKMTELLKVASPEIKDEIEMQIKLASYGEAGEKSIAFELKNSGMDMYVLHDIYIEHEDLSAQIDYLIITRKLTYVLECKNLIGNIEIDNSGQFIRTYEYNGKKIKEGIYSPITQNERHLLVLKEVRKTSVNNILKKQLFERNFYKYYTPLVVLANSKTYLNDRFAKKEVKDYVVRSDQLVDRMKEYNSYLQEKPLSDSEMKEIAEFYLSVSKPNKSDYAKKYEEMIKKTESSQNTEQSKICPSCGGTLILRTASKGINAGNKFWGCSNYPKCRFIKNVSK